MAPLLPPSPDPGLSRRNRPAARVSCWRITDDRASHFDPQILDRFFEIAPGLYETFANREDDLAARDLDVNLRRYYQADLGELLYRPGRSVQVGKETQA